MFCRAENRSDQTGESGRTAPPTAGEAGLAGSARVQAEKQPHPRAAGPQGLLARAEPPSPGTAELSPGVLTRPGGVRE